MQNKIYIIIFKSIKKETKNKIPIDRFCIYANEMDKIKANIQA